jgi:ribosomal protein S18 acetylase RimI-like enzyme
MSVQSHSTDIEFKFLVSKQELVACYEVMKELRPKLINADSFANQVISMQKNGYQLLAAVENGFPIALAGYREVEMLVHGKFIYVDDLITCSDKRGQGLGERLLKLIFEMATEKRFNKVVLDTGIGNSLAQRFYYRMGMLAVGMHFTYELDRA